MRTSVSGAKFLTCSYPGIWTTVFKQVSSIPSARAKLLRDQIIALPTRASGLPVNVVTRSVKLKLDVLARTAR